MWLLLFWGARKAPVGHMQQRHRERGVSGGLKEIRADFTEQ
jgi:hypothetical protein